MQLKTLSLKILTKIIIKKKKIKIIKYSKKEKIINNKIIIKKKKIKIIKYSKKEKIINNKLNKTNDVSTFEL